MCSVLVFGKGSLNQAYTLNINLNPTAYEEEEQSLNNNIGLIIIFFN